MVNRDLLKIRRSKYKEVGGITQTKEKGPVPELVEG
jgi:hypothetical protein